MEIAPGTVIQNKYRLEKKIGEGSSSIVYKAQDIDINKAYALKFLRKELSCLPSQRNFFLQEAKIVASIRHPAIVSIRGVGEWEQSLYFVMDYYPDKSLKELMQEKTLSIEEIRDLSDQLLQGLKEAHRLGLVHGDIKPANLMLKREDKRWKLGIVDFGMASFDAEKGTKGGTPFYMSPEQLLGGNGNKASDLYSACVCIYQMITGHFPIEAKSTEELIYRLLQEDTVPPSRFRKIPRLLDKFFAHALSLEAEARYKDIQELQDALKVAWSSRSILTWKQLTLFVSSVVLLVFVLLFFHCQAQEDYVRELLKEAEISLDHTQWGTSQKSARDALVLLKGNQRLYSFFLKDISPLEDQARSILWQILWKEFVLFIRVNEIEKARLLLMDDIFDTTEGEFLYPYFLFYFEEYRIAKALQEKDYKLALELSKSISSNRLQKKIREKQEARIQVRKQIAPLEEWSRQKKFSQAKLYLERIRHTLPREIVLQMEEQWEKEQTLEEYQHWIKNGHYIKAIELCQKFADDPKWQNRAAFSLSLFKQELSKNQILSPKPDAIIKEKTIQVTGQVVYLPDEKGLYVNGIPVIVDKGKWTVNLAMQDGRQEIVLEYRLPSQALILEKRTIVVESQKK